ncbi:hypothetical protein PV08_03845 [Exophiala spinifera]|uniref:PHD-type domain-containing protein n=1 Tax=Exophiala spinifera TaxID=91928 RepID=A0A0D1ZVA0_9EURO|nr:uncharacterized protein PV08_03845 [Exophiala spinifera]KIW16657.1 hypothetical protein PV08_03845 [Exophiala spinifera]
MPTQHTVPDGQTDTPHPIGSVYGVTPPSGPRSMRRCISPPPLRRSSTDGFTPEPFKTLHASHIAHVRDEYEGRNTAFGSHRPIDSTSNGSKYPTILPKPSELGTLPIPRTNAGDSAARAKAFRANVESESRYGRGAPSFKDQPWPASLLNEFVPEPGTADKRASTTARLHTGGYPDRQQELAAGHIPRVEDDAHHRYARVRTAGAADPPQKDSRPSFSPENVDHTFSTVPSSHASSPRVLTSHLPRSPPYSPPLTINGDGAGSEHAMLFNKLTQEPINQPVNKSIPSLADVGLARSYLTETASSTSTTSRTQNMCRGCRKSGNQLLPLIPCRKCRRGFHKGCGDPKPSQSASSEDFVCGRCLKMELKAGASDKSEAQILPPGNSIESLQPASSVPSFSHTAASGIKKVQPSNEVPMTITWAGPPRDLQETSKASGAVIIAKQSDRYKHITCPWWQSSECVLAEPHCEFAHTDTGQYAPSGAQPAKEFTCSFWLYGRCYRREEDCWYAHADTGLYMGRDHRPSKKHITCYYWHTGYCRQANDACLFAHKETGIVAWQPVKGPETQPGPYSLKSYTCPRWERQQPCRWKDKQCPYSHAQGGVSCVEVEAACRPNKSLPNPSMGGRQSTSHPPSGESSLPLWARSARETPVKFRKASFSSDSMPSNPVMEPNDHSQQRSSDSPTKPLEFSIQASGSNATEEGTIAESAKRHMAKRSRPFDSRPRNIRNIVQNQPSLTSAAQQVIDNDKSQDSAATRKLCTVCKKTTINASHCPGCKASAAGAEYPTPSVGGGITLSPMPMSPFSEEQSAVRMSEEFLPLYATQSQDDATLQQALVANRLKRHATDDHLNIIKRSRLSPTSAEQAQGQDAVTSLQPSVSEGSVIEERAPLTSTSQQTPSNRGKPDITQAKIIDDTVEQSHSGRYVHQLAAPQALSSFQNSMSASPHMSTTPMSPPMARSDNKTTLGQDELVTRENGGKNSFSKSETFRPSSKGSHQHRSDHSRMDVNGEYASNATATASSGADLVLSNGHFKRCRRCNQSGTHKRCLHDMNGLLSPTKCSMFISKYHMRYPGHNTLTRRDWDKIVRTAQGSSQGDSPIQTLDELEDETVDIDGIPGRIKDDGLRKMDRSSGQQWMRAESAPTIQLSEVMGHLTDLVLGRPVQPGKPSVQPRYWSRADEEKAIQKLQARGVQFESDTGNEEEEEEQEEEEDEEEEAEKEEEVGDDSPPPRRIDPLWQPQRSRDLFEIDRSWDRKMEHQVDAKSVSRPPKKQIIGNLLKYQCLDRRRKFSNAHQEVRRSVQQVEVRAWVQVDKSEDPKELPQLVEEEVMMTFGEFIGMPEAPVIAHGKHRDELEYTDRHERNDRRGHGLGDGIAAHRARRIGEENRFPFVYTSR